MIIFLTSSFLDYQAVSDYKPRPLRDDNHFKENMKRYWKPDSHVLVFSSAPADAQLSDHIAQEFYDAFTLADFSIGNIRCFDNRTIEAFQNNHKDFTGNPGREALKEALLWADVFYLSGGHAPTENRFMQQCDLKALLSDQTIFDGLFIGLSAGSLNAASQVYLAPEVEGESIDPEFVKSAGGLGLTSMQILPHSQYIKTISLDGKDYINDIIAKDSIGRKIYMIPDGSYFILNNGITELFGDGEIIENGSIRPISGGIINEDNYHIRNSLNQAYQDSIRLFDSLITNYYDWILEVNTQTDEILFYHMSSRFLDKGLIPVQIDSFEALIAQFSATFVVTDEKQPVVEQISTKKIISELSAKGSYVRTIHINVWDGIQAVNLRVVPVAENQARLLVCLVDISMALDHDWMTDEYSRTGFLNKAELLLKQGKIGEGYSLVYTNIQGFKAINDLLGTFHGDMVIFRERDILVEELDPILIARLESDHFVLITKTTNITPQKLDILCHQEYVAGSKRMPMLIRCGIYHITDSTKKVQYMLDHAKLTEKAILPRHGVPYAVSDEKQRNEYVNQRRFVSEVEHALQNREFLTYYQPIVDAKTRKIISAEALIRWMHPEKGMIPPYQFIPVFEKEGIISKIDSYMINNVINFNLKRMQNGQQVIPCAVNLSRADFYDTKLLSSLTSTLGHYQNIQNILKLEVTESAYAVLESDAISFLHEMKKLGLSILLDDFGSGMSSLSTLESFAFDIIKLDIGFTAKIGKNSKSEAIIKNTIGLSHDIGAKVIAEGVETAEQLAFLQSAGCDMIQGYYFYKPISEEEFSSILP